MPEWQNIQADDGTVRMVRNSFRLAGIDDYTPAPSQDPDSFQSLHNVMTGVEGGRIKRRWGTTLFSTTSINARRIFETHFVNGRNRFILTASNATDVRLGKTVDQNSQSCEFYYDDAHWNDAAYPGAGQVDLIKPNANGTYQTFTQNPVGPQHWECCDLVPPNGSEYLTSTLVAGDAETENLGAITSLGQINCVQAFLIGERSLGVADGSIKVRVRSATTNSDSDAVASTTTTTIYARLYETDPATGAAWLEAAVNALQTGGVEAGASNTTNMFLTGAIVDHGPAPATGAKQMLMMGVG